LNLYTGHPALNTQLGPVDGGASFCSDLRPVRVVRPGGQASTGRQPAGGPLRGLTVYRQGLVWAARGDKEGNGATVPGRV